MLETLKKISSSTIQSRVTDEIRDAIVSGRMKQGEKVSEESLSQSLGVSRTPVREALKQLQQEGLVEIIPSVGTCVARQSEKQVFELFALKEVLEGLAAREMALIKPVKAIELMQGVLQRQRLAFENNDEAQFREENRRFHDAVALGSENGKLQQHLRLLINQVPYERFVFLSLQQPNRMMKSLAEHEQIAQAICSGDEMAAEEHFRRHVRSSAAELHKGLIKTLLQDG